MLKLFQCAIFGVNESTVRLVYQVASTLCLIYPEDDNWNIHWNVETISSYGAAKPQSQNYTCESQSYILNFEGLKHLSTYDFFQHTVICVTDSIIKQTTYKISTIICFLKSVTIIIFPDREHNQILLLYIVSTECSSLCDNFHWGYCPLHIIKFFITQIFHNLQFLQYFKYEKINMFLPPNF